MGLQSQANARSLRVDLPNKLHEAQEARLPLLSHLNADTTWLLSIPYPDAQSAPAGRVRFNILIDPWLKGPQSDVAAWFSTQRHAIRSSVQTTAELDNILAEAEAACLANCVDENSSEADRPTTFIDCVAISHEFTDHCHQSTLQELAPTTPVFATAKAAELIRTWSHFKAVIEMPAFVKGLDWRETSLGPLPGFVGISRLTTEGNALYYHSAVVICFRKSQSQSDAEAVIYTPHGVDAATFTAIREATPPISTLAFLHGLHDVSITLTKQLNLGAYNGLKAQRLLRAKYWVGTHDEVKHGGGLVGPLLRRKTYTVKDALDRERRQNPSPENDQASSSYSELGNGEVLVLA